MNSQEISQAKPVIEKFFQLLGIKKEPIIRFQEDTLFIEIVDKEEGPEWIGEGGETLNTLEKLLHKILLNKTKRHFYLWIDINEYRKRREEYLRSLAQEAANEVALTRKEKELDPMSPRERRVIHLTLRDRPDVVTESRGEGKERRVVIKPSSL